MKYNALKKYLLNKDAATAIEYGLILAGLAVFIAVVVFTMGDNLASMFGAINTEMQDNLPD